jgi:hypothetical protein
MSANLEQEVSRGKEAEAILANELVKGSWAEIEKAIVEAIAQCPARDKEGQHELFLQLQANRRHKQIFTRHIETGKMASMQLSKLERIAEKVSARFR